MGAASALVLAADAVIGAGQLASLLGPSGISLATVSVATSSGHLSPEALGRGAYQSAFSVGPAGHHTLPLLAAVASALQPGGTLVVRELGGSEVSQEALSKRLLLSGFTNAVVLPEGHGMKASKPLWETGAKAAISLQPRGGAAGAKTWTLAAEEEQEEELVDEDELLTEEDRARPIPAPAGGADCEAGAAGRRACANCTCGRAEGKVAKLTREMLDNPGSSGGCGSCSLGDAFRCGGCPYRGLPAFEPGKKIELPPDFLDSDLA